MCYVSRDGRINTAYSRASILEVKSFSQGGKAVRWQLGLAPVGSKSLIGWAVAKCLRKLAKAKARSAPKLLQVAARHWCCSTEANLKSLVTDAGHPGKQLVRTPNKHEASGIAQTPEKCKSSDTKKRK